MAQPNTDRMTRIAVFAVTALAVSEMGGMKTGSADVKVDGSTYTITGQAAGADMKNPMAGMISKNFEIKVSCG